MIRFNFLLFLFLLFAHSFAQPAMSEKDRLSFDKLFFDGNKEKIIKNYEEAEKHFKAALAINQSSADVNFQLAFVLYSNKKRDEAINYAEKAVKLAPENVWYAKFLINCFKETSQVNEAIAQCERTFKLTKNIDFLNLKADLQLRKGDYTNAVKTYDQLEKYFGSNENYTLQKEKLYLILNKPAKAIKELEKFVASNPDNTTIKGMLADLYLNYKQQEKAIKLYSEILQVEPKNGYAAFSLADYYKSKDDLEKYYEMVKLGMASKVDPNAKLKMLSILIPSKVFGSDHLKKCDALVDVFLETNANNPEPYLFKGDLFLQQSDFENARIWYIKATEVNPSELVAWDQIIVCDQQLSKFDWMKEDCKKMMELFPQYPAPYIYFGVACKRLGKIEEALNPSRLGITFATDEESLISLLLNLGDVAFHSNQFELSDSAFEAVLAMSPDNSLALNNYAYFLSLRNKDLDKAENLSKRSLVFDPTNAASLDTYGWILFMKGDYEQAKVQIEKSLKSFENSAEVLEHYGDVLFKLGQKEAALVQWKKAASLGGNSPALTRKIETGIIP
jgi:tetratricopeptide (TPR) repeat protein